MVCKGMKFSRFPLDEHICYLKLTSCEYQSKILFYKYLFKRYLHWRRKRLATVSVVLVLVNVFRHIGELLSFVYFLVEWHACPWVMSFWPSWPAP